MKLIRTRNYIKKAQISTLNLFTSSEDDLRTAFDLMEFNGFFDQSLNKDNYSIKQAKETAERMSQSVEEERIWAKENDEDWIEVRDNNLNETVPGSIYGMGGWNRYFIRRNGNVLFSSIHANQKQDIQNAKDLGFEIL